MNTKFTKLSFDSNRICLGPFCEPGQTLYYSAWNDIVIPVKVLEVNDIYSYRDYGSLFVNKFLDGRSYANYPTEEMDDSGWNVQECTEDYQDLIKDNPIRNQWLWIDEPIGHELTLGDEVFLTLEEAMSVIRPTNKRHLKRRLSYFRKRMSGFITHTWRMNGEKGPNFPKWEMKKVYVKKG